MFQPIKRQTYRYFVDKTSLWSLVGFCQLQEIGVNHCQNYRNFLQIIGFKEFTNFCICQILLLVTKGIFEMPPFPPIYFRHNDVNNPCFANTSQYTILLMLNCPILHHITKCQLLNPASKNRPIQTDRLIRSNKKTIDLI